MSARKDDALRVPEPGDIIAGKYRIERVLGSGGMGVVMVAEHMLLGHRVAMKFAAPASASKDVLARFVREARAVTALESENVVRILDFGQAENGAPPYMVMQLLVGQDLSSEARARGGRLPVADVADYAIQACAGLAEAHARGIIHRDIKLGNLFLTRRPNGEPLVKILDFGIAKATGDDERDATITSTASFLGSPAYASPEQVRHAKPVDLRVDIWALGVVIHRLVTGDTPFAGESRTAVLAAIVADPPVPLRAVVPDAPEDLEAVVLRCLQKSPAFRYASVVDLAGALAPFASSGGRRCAERLEREYKAGAPVERMVSPADDARDGPPGLPSETGGTLTGEVASSTAADASPPPRRPWKGVGAIGALFVGAALMLTSFAVRAPSQSPPAPPPAAAAPPSALPPLLPAAPAIRAPLVVLAPDVEVRAAPAPSAPPAASARAEPVGPRARPVAGAKHGPPPLSPGPAASAPRAPPDPLDDHR